MTCGFLQVSAAWPAAAWCRPTVVLIATEREKPHAAQRRSRGHCATRHASWKSAEVPIPQTPTVSGLNQLGTRLQPTISRIVLGLLALSRPLSPNERLLDQLRGSSSESMPLGGQRIASKKMVPNRADANRGKCDPQKDSAVDLFWRIGLRGAAYRAFVLPGTTASSSTLSLLCLHEGDYASR